jgi:flagellar biosynthesis protein FlhG
MTTQAETAPQATAAPRRIAIGSGKGGVGKTWFAITLAHALAQAGRAVVLFDGDLGLANIDIQLGLPPGPDLGAVLAGRMPLAAAVQPYTPGGFGIVAGRSGSGALAALAPGALDALLDAMPGLPCQDILLDMGAGLDPAMRRIAARADTLLVLATDEPTSLTDAYAVLKLHARDTAETGGGDARIVINQAQTEAAGERTYTTLARACANFLGHTPRLAGIVRRDDKVRDTIRHQTSLLTRHPGSAAAADVARIAASLG